MKVVFVFWPPCARTGRAFWGIVCQLRRDPVVDQDRHRVYARGALIHRSVECGQRFVQASEAVFDAAQLVLFPVLVDEPPGAVLLVDERRQMGGGRQPQSICLRKLDRHNLLPAIKGLLRNIDLVSQLRDRHAQLGLLEHRDGLLDREMFSVCAS
jgi:hypothetical protein